MYKEVVHTNSFRTIASKSFDPSVKMRILLNGSGHIWFVWTYIHQYPGANPFLVLLQYFDNIREHESSGIGPVTGM